MEHEDYPDPTPPSAPYPEMSDQSRAPVARPRQIKVQKDVTEAIGTAADKSEEIYELLNERQTGEDSELEQSLDRIATMLETFDLRLERIEAKLGIQDDD